MTVTVSRIHSSSHSFIASTWFHEKAGDEAITCSINTPPSQDRILDAGCSFVLKGSGKEEEVYRSNYQEYATEYKAGDVINHRYPATIRVTSLEDDSVWCYISDRDDSKVITGECLFVSSTNITMFSTDDKPVYLMCPHEDVEIDGEVLDRKEIKKIDANECVVITSVNDVYIATFTYD